jgi:hypothetical protein
MGVSLRTAQELGMSEPELTKARLAITSAWRRALDRLGAVLGLSQPTSSPSLPDDDDQLLLQALEVERELDLTIRGAMLQESDQRLARGRRGRSAASGLATGSSTPVAGAGRSAGSSRRPSAIARSFWAASG